MIQSHKLQNITLVISGKSTKSFECISDFTHVNHVIEGSEITHLLKIKHLFKCFTVFTVSDEQFLESLSFLGRAQSMLKLEQCSAWQ